MNFTYHAYEQLLEKLAGNGYRFSVFREESTDAREVILRHDVDVSLKRAVEMSELEKNEGVPATYFLLLRTDFYNVASHESQVSIKKILGGGHEIGLHFDETAYSEASDWIEAIQEEANLLSCICDCPIRAVSMHRPSEGMLKANLRIPGIINTYGKRFFEDYKYVSDSRRHWREPILEYLEDCRFERLQILTHPFWYQKTEIGMRDTLLQFIDAGKRERYLSLRDNIRNMDEIISSEEILT